jgi:hypothetical protein
MLESKVFALIVNTIRLLKISWSLKADSILTGHIMKLRTANSKHAPVQKSLLRKS